LSGGRAGWNLVTSGQEGAAANFGDRNHQDHDLRYVKAEEHLRVVRGLWDSWEDGAFLYDAASGAYYDRRKLHTLNHSGKFFSVRGPLNIERSQQGHPVVFQAGSSEAGRGLAASSCDVVFISSHRLDEAKKISADLRRRMEENGRNPDDLVIICGTYFMVEDSVEKAEAAYRQYAETVPIEGALKRLGGTFGHHDFSVYPLDAPFPDLEGLAANGFQSATSMVVEEAEASGLTLRQTALSYATPRSSFIGTPISVVDEIERWVAEGAADGFALFGLPDRVSLAHVARVVPELQRRGLFRRRYETATLRGHLGLAVPPNRHSQSL
ncbi:MAG: LLM class flavin-dependent oxidoreductase, partial [Alcaligenaceae bacterium]